MGRVGMDIIKLSHKSQPEKVKVGLGACLPVDVPVVQDGFKPQPLAR